MSAMDFNLTCFADLLNAKDHSGQTQADPELRHLVRTCPKKLHKIQQTYLIFQTYEPLDVCKNSNYCSYIQLTPEKLQVGRVQANGEPFYSAPGSASGGVEGSSG